MIVIYYILSFIRIDSNHYQSSDWNLYYLMVDYGTDLATLLDGSKNHD